MVEDIAVSTETGARRGLLFAANGLISKCLTGVGTFLSGLILAWVSFFRSNEQFQVRWTPRSSITSGMVFVPIVATFSAIAIAVLMLYDIDRSKHQRNIEQLESAAGADSHAGALEDFPSDPPIAPS